MSLNADPISVHLNAATADQIHAANVAVPASGFYIAGLTLTSIQGSAVSVPDALTCLDYEPLPGVCTATVRFAGPACSPPPGTSASNPEAPQ